MSAPWFRGPYGWQHRPRWKVVVNTVLRALQRTPTPVLVFTRTLESDDTTVPPVAIGYGVGRVRVLP